MEFNTKRDKEHKQDDKNNINDEPIGQLFPSKWPQGYTKMNKELKTDTKRTNNDS